MPQEIDKMYITSDYLPAIINDDYSGLEIYDEESILEWLDNYERCVFQCGDYSEFEICAITGLHSNCVEVTIYKDI